MPFKNKKKTNEYRRKYRKEHPEYTEKYYELRRSRKRALVEYKGGKCARCGYNKSFKALDFHHLDSADKKFTVAYYTYKPMEELQEEVDKCILLCANCHREIHY